MPEISEARIHQAFRISVILKGLHALLEIAGGLLFYAVSTQEILDLVNRITRMELTRDPRDFVATHLLSAAQGFTSSTEAFYAWYLVSHGLIKVVLVAGLLKEKLVAYPVSLAVIAAFIAYQLHRYSYTHSVFLLILTGFDLLVMVLVWHEWRLRRQGVPGRGAHRQ